MKNDKLPLYDLKVQQKLFCCFKRELRILFSPEKFTFYKKCTIIHIFNQPLDVKRDTGMDGIVLQSYIVHYVYQGHESQDLS